MQWLDTISFLLLLFTYCFVKAETDTHRNPRFCLVANLFFLIFCGLLGWTFRKYEFQLYPISLIVLGILFSLGAHQCLDLVCPSPPKWSKLT